MSEIKTVLITGTSSGFGLLTARTLLQKGFTVIATMRDVEGRNTKAAGELRNLAERTAGTVHVLELDVTSDSSVVPGIQKALEVTGTLDVVINNAGIGAGGYAEAFTMDQWKRIFEVNVFGVQRINRAVLPYMRQTGRGLIIQVSSVMGRVVLPYAAPYTATKWALEGMTESLRYELASTGVDVVIVEPGGFMTGFGERMIAPADDERVSSYGEISDAPQQMWGGIMEHLSGEDGPDPQDVADVIVELIETPAGLRPLRTVVDPMTGGFAPRTINQTSDEVQSRLMESLGITSAQREQVSV